jgi:hypothetical protein
VCTEADSQMEAAMVVVLVEDGDIGVVQLVGL